MAINLTPGQSPFGKIGQARASVNSAYFRAGRYLTHIDGFKVSENRKNEGFVVFEMTVVAVLDDRASAKDPSGAHRVGEKTSWLMKFSQDTAMPNLKGAVMAITQVPEAKIDEPFCLALASEAQPMRGFFVEWDNSVITTKAGNPFTKIVARRRWSKADVEANIPADVLTGLKLTTQLADG